MNVLSLPELPEDVGFAKEGKDKFYPIYVVMLNEDLDTGHWLSAKEIGKKRSTFHSNCVFILGPVHTKRYWDKWYWDKLQLTI